ncbi:MAG: glycosyltransferase family 39 protein [bacterium]
MLKSSSSEVEKPQSKSSRPARTILSSSLERFLSSRQKLIFIVIFIASFLIISYGINQTGETWDEIPYYNAGRSYYSNLIHLNFKSSAWDANKEHPPVAKYVYGLFSSPGYFLDGEHYTGGRIASALLLSLTIALVSYFVTELFSATIGLFSSIILMLTPPFIAYGRILGMDSISALAFLLLAIVSYRFARSKGGWRDYILPTLTLALAFATRYNTILAALFGPVAILLFAPWKKDYRRWLALLAIPIGSAIVFYLVWPYLWSDPIGALKTSFGHWGQVREWYMGQKDAVLPSSYFLTYFFYSVPVGILVLAALGIFSREKIKNKLFIIALLVLPFINSFVGIKQGGVRYLLFVFIPIGVLAALGFVYLLKILKQKYLQIILIILLVCYGLFNVVTHYPYYLDYYNEFIGGSRGNYENKFLQFGWWGQGGKRAADFLNKNAPQGASVFNNMKPDHTLDNLRTDIRLVMDSETPDFIVFNTNWAWISDYQIPTGYKIVHEEKSGGGTILTIIRRK